MECFLDGIGGYIMYYCDIDFLKYFLVFIKVVKLVELVFFVRIFLFDSDEDNCDLIIGGFNICFVYYVYIVILEFYFWIIFIMNIEF